jgi:hypothetical protein
LGGSRFRQLGRRLGHRLLASRRRRAHLVGGHGLDSAEVCFSLDAKTLQNGDDLRNI